MVTALAVGLAGCGLDEMSPELRQPPPSGPTDASSSPSPTTKAPPSLRPPQPVSAAVYQQALTDLDSALALGFFALGAALAPADVESAADGLAGELDLQATKLGRITPPTAVATAHEDLTTALGALADDLETLAGDAADWAVCTGGTGLPRASSGNGAHLFRLAAGALATADPAHPYAVGTFLPAGSPDPGRRPGNGSLPGGQRGGYGELTVIHASGSTDAVVKLMANGQVTRSVYVQAGTSTTVDGIPNGTYEVFFTTGNDWDDVNQRFTRDCSFEKFEDPVEFTTRDLGSSIEYTTWELTLYAVEGGNAPTTAVDPGAFPVG
ncbi:MAG: hypothetical protein IRZ08_06930 [Frankia sp.]|nr:hypothetical protein [Frankia sp.]